MRRKIRPDDISREDHRVLVLQKVVEFLLCKRIGLDSSNPLE